jgi:NTP pyrophosphatase (non-canonical NTP hydrolase)
MGESVGKTRILDLEFIQLERDEWVAHNFPNDREEDPFMGMVEEMGELAHHLLKSSQGIRGEGVDHQAEIKDACADLVIFMLGIASHRGFILAEEIDKVWRQVRERDWIKFPHDGVSR